LCVFVFSSVAFKLFTLNFDIHHIYKLHNTVN